MELHHQKAIADFLGQYRDKPEFTAVLLAGSLAHGFAKPDSDVDILLVATPAEFQKRQTERPLAFSLWDICQYPGGYIDCKVVSLDSMRLVAEKGSDAARYAFKDAQILHGRTPELEQTLKAVCRFPSEQAAQHQHRFACQLLAWKWYLSQAELKQDPYLFHLSCQKFSLFACRLVLNANGLLYPFHKWLLRETQNAARQPQDFQADLRSFLAQPNFALAQKMADSLFGLLGLVEKQIDWPNQFMVDSEMNWLNQEAPIDDL